MTTRDRIRQQVEMFPGTSAEQLAHCLKLTTSKLHPALYRLEAEGDIDGHWQPVPDTGPSIWPGKRPIRSRVYTVRDPKAAAS